MNKQNTRPVRRVLAVILSLALLLTFTPLSGMVTLSAGALDDAVTYIGADGTLQTITDYTLVKSHDGPRNRMWEAGNYVVRGNVTINVTGKAAVKFLGTVNLILCDDAQLTVNSTNSSAFTGIDRELNIFAQSTDSNKGKLTAKGDTGVDCGSLNVYGGEVTFEGTSYGLHFDGYNDSEGLTVNGGDVRIVNNTDDQAVIYDESSVGHLTVDGGTLTVSSSGGGKAIEYINSIAFNDGTGNITGNITDFSTLALNGGNVTINGGLGGFDEDASDNEIILDYQRPTDKYKITNLNKLSDKNDYTVKVAENKTVSADGTSYTGTLTAAQRAAISGKDITPFFGTVTVADGITGGTVTADKTSDLLYGDTVTLNVTPKTGYALKSITAGSAEVTKVDDTHYTFTMPASDVTVSATFTPDSAYFSQDGDTYTIHDDTGWDIFCDCLQDNDTYNRFSGKTVLLADDITVTRMAGGADHDFKGIFDGQGHTLTVAYGTADSPVSDDDKAAPFRNVESGCVIKNLHTQGTIYTSKKYAGGIVGTQYGTVRLENCRSSVTINSMTAGDGSHGGLVGHIGNSTSAKLTIDGCVFDGKLLSVGDDPTTNCAGFVGYKGNNATFTITNSLYAPKALEADETEAATGSSATFVRNGSAGANCYYTRTLGTAQGKQPYTITAGDDVTLGLSGEATEYGVSGITAYAGSNGLKYGDIIYTDKDENVALTVAPSVVGYAVNSVSVNDGAVAVTSNENGTYSFTMPDSNAAVTAELEEASYFDEKTGTLTLKGNVLNSVAGIVLPDGVNKNDVQHIDVDSSGATLPQDSSWLFENFTNVTSIDLTGADTRNVTNMDYMFYYCENLTELDLSSFDTSCVEDMSGMFIACANLTELDLSSFDTSSVNNMEYMFDCCDFLEKLDLSSFDTSSVNHMTNMFSGCEHLTELNLSSFDTRYVTEMNSMFLGCFLLKTIYVSERWSTESVTDSTDMFEYCRSLKGGNDTAYDGSKIDMEYACIDKDGQPGYLTGVYTLTLPDHMEIVTEEADKKVGNKYLSGAALTVKPKAGYTASNVQANDTDLTADENGIYTITMPDGNVTVTADFTFSDGIGAALAGHSISLEGDIGVNFYIELDDNIVNSETAKMRFTIPTGSGTTTQDVLVKDAIQVTSGDKTYYVFKCQVAAKEMTSQITAQLLDGDLESDVFPYSVKEYADYLLAHTGDNADYAKAAPLVKAMLNYGANSQLYFDKNTGTLANADLTNEEKALGDVEITIADPVINPPDGVTFEGATLSLKSETTLSLYFTSSDDLTFSCGDYTVETATRGDYQIARIRGIKAADIGKTLTLNVSGGTVSYSPLNYCKYVLADDSQDEKLQNAVKALYLYWQAAAAYFGAPAPDPAAGIFFTKVTDESEITRGNISVCTFAQAKAWAIANWDDITVTEKNDVDIVFSDGNDICYFSIKIGVTAIQDIEEMSEPYTGMEIDAIKYYYTDHEEDVYLCGRFFKKVTDESQITVENIGKCTFDEAKAWVIANWEDIMGTDSNSVHIVFFNGDDIWLISISEMTDITDFMEIDEPEATDMAIDFIQDFFTDFREDVYLCSPAALP